ncbi:MAG: potassium/proton antiporter [Bacteroidota bacterium]
MNHFSYIILFASVLVVLSVMAGKFFSRYGFSTLLVTLGIGMLFGNGGKYDFDYNYPSLTLHISEIALCFIIFSGGFETQWNKFRPFLLKGIALATSGVLLTAFVLGMAVHYLLNWPFMESLLIGAIVSSTDAAAVFSILESSKLKLKNGISETLQLESGTNDPMAYFLTTCICSVIVAPGSISYTEMAIDFIQSMSLGFVSGWIVAVAIHWLIVKSKLKKGQNPVMLISTVLLLYSLNSIIGGSAFLSVYIAGIVLGNRDWPNRVLNINFFEGFSWLMETVLFLILGLQLYLYELDEILAEGLIISALLIFVARPFGTHGSLLMVKKFSWKDSAFISWVGLRGATPIVFALIPVVHHIPSAHKIFNISFIIVITSILFQGTFLPKLAKWLSLENKS